MATKQYAGNMPDGGLVNAIEQPMSFIFAWGGTAPTVTPVTLASLATAQALNTAYTVGAAVKGTDNKVYGCVKPGTSQATTAIAGPGLATNAPGPKTGDFLLPGCGITVPCWLDGTATWIQLSGPGVVQTAWLANLDKSNPANLLYHSSWASVAVGTGAAVPNSAGAYKLSGVAPESIYLIGDAASLFSVAIIV